MIVLLHALNGLVLDLQQHPQQLRRRDVVEAGAAHHALYILASQSYA
jgi:hypothetical protein